MQEPDIHDKMNTDTSMLVPKKNTKQINLLELRKLVHFFNLKYTMVA